MIEFDEEQLRDAIKLADTCVETLRAWELVADATWNGKPVAEYDEAVKRAEAASVRRRTLAEAYALRWK